MGMFLISLEIMLICLSSRWEMNDGGKMPDSQENFLDLVGDFNKYEEESERWIHSIKTLRSSCCHRVEVTEIDCLTKKVASVTTLL